MPRIKISKGLKKLLKSGKAEHPRLYQDPFVVFPEQRNSYLKKWTTALVVDLSFQNK